MYFNLLLLFCVVLVRYKNPLLFLTLFSFPVIILLLCVAAFSTKLWIQTTTLNLPFRSNIKTVNDIVQVVEENESDDDIDIHGVSCAWIFSFLFLSKPDPTIKFPVFWPEPKLIMDPFISRFRISAFDWISPSLKQGYTALHKLAKVNSIKSWKNKSVIYFKKTTLYRSSRMLVFIWSHWLFTFIMYKHVANRASTSLWTLNLHPRTN